MTPEDRAALVERLEREPRRYAVKAAAALEADPLCVWGLADLLHQYMSERRALHLAEIIDRAYRGSER